MKKLLALLLAVILCFALVACGENKNEYPIGSTLTTSVVSFSLTRFEYAERLKNATFQTGKTPDPEYLLPTEEKQSNNPFAADDGKVMISFSYTVKNTSKEKITFPVDLGIVADYNDGYEFEASVDLIKGNYVILSDTTSLDPLSEVCEGRGYIEVPKEVMDNESASLYIKISLPDDSNGEKTTEFTYKIR